MLCTYQCQASGEGWGVGRRGIWRDFDICQKIAVKFPTPGQKCEVKYNWISHPGKWFVVTGMNKNSNIPTPGPKRSIKILPYAPPPPLPGLTLIGALNCWGGRPGIGGGFDSSHRPVVGTSDRFNGLSRNILLTFSCYFDDPQMPCGRAFEQKLSAQFNWMPRLCPASPPPPPPPQQLNIDRCIMSGNNFLSYAWYNVFFP